MKKIICILGLGLMIGMLNINKVEAQVRVSVNINIQPAWGPSGYDYVEYYYIPELDIYYDIINSLFYYNNRGRWYSAPYLPAAYGYYDFYSLYKVVLNDIHYPWRYNMRHRRLYSRYCYNYAQVPIFYMSNNRYHRARKNYKVWVEPRYMPKNHGRPLSRTYSKNLRNGRVSSDLRSRNYNKSVAPVRNTRSAARSSALASSKKTNSRSESGRRVSNSRDVRKESRSSAVNSRSNTRARSSSSSVRTSNTRSRSKNSSVRTSNTRSSTNKSSRSSSSRSSKRNNDNRKESRITRM